MASAERSSNLFEAGGDSIHLHSACPLRPILKSRQSQILISLNLFPNVYFLLCFVSFLFLESENYPLKCLNKGLILQNLLYKADFF